MFLSNPLQATCGSIASSCRRDLRRKTRKQQAHVSRIATGTTRWLHGIDKNESRRRSIHLWLHGPQARDASQPTPQHTHQPAKKARSFSKRDEKNTATEPALPSVSPATKSDSPKLIAQNVGEKKEKEVQTTATPHEDDTEQDDFVLLQGVRTPVEKAVVVHVTRQPSIAETTKGAEDVGQEESASEKQPQEEQDKEQDDFVLL